MLVDLASLYTCRITSDSEVLDGFRILIWGKDNDDSVKDDILDVLDTDESDVETQTIGGGSNTIHHK